MLRLRPFELARPRSLAEAVASLQGAAMPIAGGTDLLPKLKRYQFDPDLLISLQSIEELRTLSESDGGLSIGAMVRLRELEQHPAVAQWPVLQQAVAAIATPTIRSMATVGGNLCQDTRCRYYDRSQHWREATGFCTKKDGSICRVAPGSPRCWATLCSDLAPALIALDAQVQIAGRKSRSIPLAKLYVDDGIHNLALQGELVTGVQFAFRPKYSRYLKLRLREGFDFPELGVAVSIDGEDPVQVRVAMSGTSSIIQNWHTECAVRDLSQFADTIHGEVKPMDTLWFPPDYRKAIAKVYVRQCFEEFVLLR